MRTIIFLGLFLIALTGFGQSYTFVFLNKRTDLPPMPKEEVDKLMQGHMDNIGRLAKEGKLIVAGPFEGGGGVFILKTGSTEEATQWLSTDPGIQAKRWNIELLPFNPRVGSPCVAQEPYEMVTYHFVRFTATLHKETASTYPAVFKQHDEYITEIGKTGNVIAEGIFGEHEGGILILKGDLESNVIESDPGIRQGILSFDLKKLWVAKGSFCEK